MLRTHPGLGISEIFVAGMIDVTVAVATSDQRVTCTTLFQLGAIWGYHPAYISSRYIIPWDEFGAELDVGENHLIRLAYLHAIMLSLMSTARQD